MTTDRHDPLDADERALARVLRALPAGEPPSALDAKILALARDAVVTTPSVADEARPRPHRAPRVAWGLGVAASCVLAAGLVWRMGVFQGDGFDVVGSDLPAETADAASAAAPAQPAPPMPAAEPEHVQVEIGATRQAPQAPLAPPPPPEEPVSPRPQAAPAAAAREQQAFVQRQERASERRAETEASTLEAVAAPAPLADATDDAAGASLDTITVTGTRARALLEADDDTVGDGSAGPQAWLQRIRARIARGDIEGAHRSLEAFLARYPGKALPQDLIDFRAARRAEGAGTAASEPP